VIVNAGDLIDSANSEEQWGQWYDAGGFIDGQINNISVTGNHEYSGVSLSSFWAPQFPYPDNGRHGATSPRSTRPRTTSTTRACGSSG
jgi:hypothetical protein